MVITLIRFAVQEANHQLCINQGESHTTGRGRELILTKLHRGGNCQLKNGEGGWRGEEEAGKAVAGFLWRAVGMKILICG